MKIQHLIIALIGVVHTSTSHPRGFEKLYLCDSREKTVQCSACREWGTSVRFLVEKKERFVVEYFSNGNTITRDQCNIVNEKNWVCELRVPGTLLGHTATMIDGRYAFVSNTGKRETDSALCTK